MLIQKSFGCRAAASSRKLAASSKRFDFTATSAVVNAAVSARPDRLPCRCGGGLTAAAALT